MDLVLKYFPELSERQVEQLAQLQELYQVWNARINVISRKDIHALYERHVLHSMGIARILQFESGTEVMDLGTGGGFPGVPLAVLFPETSFRLVDSVRKKIRVVDAVVESLGLTNVRTEHTRAEDIGGTFDFVVSRTVAALPKLLEWTRGKYRATNLNALPNGLLCFKGGDLSEEIAPYQGNVVLHDLGDFFEESFFETKKVVYVPADHIQAQQP